MGELRKTKRLANIELLRIVSMLMVVSLHYLSRGGVYDIAKPFSLTFMITCTWDGFSVICLNVYMLISGYVLVESAFRYKRLVDIVIQVFTYSFGFYVLMVLFGQASFSFKGLLNALLPILTSQYWFASVYVGLFLLTPFINKALHTLTQKQHLTLCILLVLMFSLYLPAKVLGQTGYGIAWMVTMYIVGAYLRMHYKPGDKLKVKHIFMWLIPTVMLPLSRFAVLILGNILDKDLSVYSTFFYKNNSVLTVCAAVAFFIMFLHIKVKNVHAQKIVTFFGPLTFGVYLVHNHPTLRALIWDVANAPSYANTGYFVFLGVVTIVVIFLLSAAVEFIRRQIYNRLLSKTIYRICDSVIEKIVRLESFYNSKKHQQ